MRRRVLLRGWHGGACAMYLRPRVRVPGGVLRVDPRDAVSGGELLHWRLRDSKALLDRHVRAVSGAVLRVVLRDLQCDSWLLLRPWYCVRCSSLPSGLILRGWRRARASLRRVLRGSLLPTAVCAGDTHGVRGLSGGVQLQRRFCGGEFVYVCGLLVPGGVLQQLPISLRARVLRNGSRRRDVRFRGLRGAVHRTGRVLLFLRLQDGNRKHVSNRKLVRRRGRPSCPRDRGPWVVHRVGGHGNSGQRDGVPSRVLLHGWGGRAPAVFVHFRYGMR